jgi:hypothetical protein
MVVTGACAEVRYLPQRSTDLVDYDEDVTYDDLAGLLEQHAEPAAPDAYVDIDPRGNDAFRF